MLSKEERKQLRIMEYNVEIKRYNQIRLDEDKARLKLAKRGWVDEDGNPSIYVKETYMGFRQPSFFYLWMDLLKIDREGSND